MALVTVDFALLVAAFLVIVGLHLNIKAFIEYAVRRKPLLFHALRYDAEDWRVKISLFSSVRFVNYLIAGHSDDDPKTRKFRRQEITLIACAIVVFILIFLRYR